MQFETAGTLECPPVVKAPMRESVYTVGRNLYVPPTPADASTLLSHEQPSFRRWPDAVRLKQTLSTLVLAEEHGVLVIDLYGGGSLASEGIRNVAARREQLPSQNNFEYLARHDPPRLLRWISSGTLPDAALTFAAEAAGLIANSLAVVSALLPLLQHASAPVREGAIYGLQRHLAEPRAREAIKKTLEVDLSTGVREAAQEALEQVDD